MFENAVTRHALLGQRFNSTQTPVCLWFVAKNKNADDDIAAIFAN